MQFEANTDQMPDAIRDSITKLRVKFIDSMEYRILSLEASIACLEQGGNERAKAAEEACRQVHNTAGLASSLGFEEIGAVALQADQTWSHAIKHGLSQSLMDPALEVTEQLLDLLERQIDTTIEAPGAA